MPKPEIAPETGDNSAIAIDFDVLEAVLADLGNKKKAVTEANGKHGSSVKAVIDNHGWHKGALADIRKIDAMSETARADYLRTLEPMLEAMLSFKWRAETEDLFNGKGD